MYKKPALLVLAMKIEFLPVLVCKVQTYTFTTIFRSVTAVNILVKLNKKLPIFGKNSFDIQPTNFQMQIKI